ncbi:hypothetical protein ACIQ9P_39115 [Kitasatospora sp. NPDC094019]|uniref:hypothetical protein n=1 Tax=Kitasatospora sp. NPDC094019 TaxID=3364091 RepID=UPI00381A5AE2
MRNTRIDELMARADPAAGASVPEADRALLGRILADPAGPPGPAASPAPVRAGGRRRLVYGLACAAAAAVTAVAVLALPGSGGTSFAATPPPLAYHLTAQQAGVKAGTELLSLAQRVRGLPDVPAAGAAGEGALRWRQWSLNTRDDHGKVTSKVVPVENEVTPGPQGPVLTSRSLEDGKERVERMPATPTLPQGEVPATGTALKDWLRGSTPGVDNPNGASQVLRDLLTQRVLGPASRAAVLEWIAGLPGLEITGDVTDRAGRPGVAYSALSSDSGLPTRYTFVVDPASGSLLAMEEMLTETAGMLNVPVPSVISYTVYLDRAR